MRIQSMWPIWHQNSQKDENDDKKKKKDQITRALFFFYFVEDVKMRRVVEFLT